MRLTRRDVRLVGDIALSHVMSRDQILALGYFGSVTRANTRLRALGELSLICRLEPPFFGQGLYVAGSSASEIVAGRIARLVGGRAPSPRFIQHALSVTNVRLAFGRKGPGEWRFEQQLWRKLDGPNPMEVRPDGLFMATTPIFVEADMGHVAPSKFKEKLSSYRILAHSGQCHSLYGFAQFRVLTVTTGNLRARHLRRLLPPDPGFDLMVQTFEEVGVAPISAWS